MDPQQMKPRDAVGSNASDRRAIDAFGVLLDEVRGHVDRELASWLAPRVSAAHRLSADVGAAADALSGLALRGGKRMRAALVGAGYVACGGEGSWRAATSAMLAIELLQAYLLVHDDWMDDDDVRRGGPTVHVAMRAHFGSASLGDASAILAGDLACGFAQEALLESSAPPPRLLAAARAFARIQVDVVRGQMAEMAAVTGRPAPPVETIHALKTASYTVEGPLALGAALAGADADRVAELSRYGRPLGVAFQLRDDLLGIFGDAAATGKPVGNDIRQGKRTSLVAAMEGDAVAAPVLARAFGRSDASAEDVAAVMRAMETSGARDRVEARLGRLLAESRDALAAMRLGNGAPIAEEWLAGAIVSLGERSS